MIPKLNDYKHVDLKPRVIGRPGRFSVEFHDRRNDATYPITKFFPTKRGAELFASQALIVLAAVNPILVQKRIDVLGKTFPAVEQP